MSPRWLVSPSSLRLRMGMTLIELMIAIAILGVMMAGVVGAMFALHRTQQADKETAIAQQIAQALAERVMGATWNKLGQSSDPWSWHRREAPRARRLDGTLLAAINPLAPVYAEGGSPRYPPMTETDASDGGANNLISIGLVSAPTGVADLRVYLEYYRMDALNAGGETLILRGGDGVNANALVFPRRAPTAAEQGIDWGHPESALTTSLDHINLALDSGTGGISNDAVLVRVLITWTSSIGGSRRHEVLFARRQ